METIPKKEDEKGAATTAVTTTNQNAFADIIQTVDLSKKDLSAKELKEMETAIANAEALPIDLTEGYWTPQNAGETKKLLFQKVVVENYVDEKTSEVIALETAHFTELEDGVAKVVKNASWRLVKAVQSMNPGSVLMVIYNGKKKNSTNSNMSDVWIVKPLVLKLK